ncbi:RtcB family protein [Mycobacterium lepromatosis]|uniref:RtcB family protein n=1 Tax=Mycobacterium lepromatosis TaxID=480418 RepID=UPI000AB82DDA
MIERGLEQIGCLGSEAASWKCRPWNVLMTPPTAATQMGLSSGAARVMIHTCSSGLGHQICTNHVHQMGNCLGQLQYSSTRPLADGWPVHSPEGQVYLAMVGRIRTRQPVRCSPERLVGCSRSKPRHC